MRILFESAADRHLARDNSDRDEIQISMPRMKASSVERTTRNAPTP